jgi:hypothetical protein
MIGQGAFCFFARICEIKRRVNMPRCGVRFENTCCFKVPPDMMLVRFCVLWRYLIARTGCHTAQSDESAFAIKIPRRNDHRNDIRSPLETAVNGRKLKMTARPIARTNTSGQGSIRISRGGTWGRLGRWCLGKNKNRKSLAYLHEHCGAWAAD